MKFGQWAALYFAVGVVLAAAVAAWTNSIPLWILTVVGAAAGGFVGAWFNIPEDRQ